MSELLEYLDSVSIDVVKRKYYNANKVNAVFEEIRRMAEALTEENMRLNNEAATVSARQQQALKELDSLMNAYREALQAAHSRADKMLSDASEESAVMLKNAESRSELAAKQVEECLNAIRVREEQNIEFINARMQRFLSSLYEQEELPAVTAENEEDPLQLLQSRVSALSSEIHALESEPVG